MSDATNKTGWLKKAFTFAVKTTLTVGLGITFGALVMDPTMLPVLHDLSNIPAQALIMKMQDYTGWVPEAFGLVGEDGLMYDFMQNWLSEEIDLLTPTADIQTGQALESMNFEF